MKTHKETFNGADNFDMSFENSNGLEKMVRDEIAQQVADVLKNI